MCATMSIFMYISIYLAIDVSINLSKNIHMNVNCIPTTKKPPLAMSTAYFAPKPNLFKHHDFLVLTYPFNDPVA